MATESEQTDAHVAQLDWLDGQLAPLDTTEHDRTKNILKAAAAGVVAVSGAVLLHTTGLDSTLLDHKITPMSPVFEQATVGIIAANDVIREVAPIAVIGGIASQVISSRRAKTSLRGKMKHDYAETDYSGLETANANRKSGLNMRVRKATAGLALGATAAMFITGSAAIEQEVSNGPTRAINHLVDTLAEDGKEVSIISQSENSHMMNNSYVHVSGLNRITEEARSRDQNIQVTYFNRDLSDITYADGSRTTGLLIGMPAEKLFGEQVAVAPVDCEAEIPVIADEAASVSVGDTLTLDGDMKVRVIGEMSQASSMNRTGIGVEINTLKDCFQNQAGVEDSTVFGAVVSGADSETMNEIMQAVGVSENDAVAITKDRFIANNEKFWRANGTPILLQQILYLAGFAGVAVAGARLTAMLQSTRELGALMGQAVKEKQLKAVETTRSLWCTLKASALGAVPAVGLAAAVNATERGLQVGVTARDAAVAYTVLAVSSVIGARRGVKKFAKNNDPAEATAR